MKRIRVLKAIFIRKIIEVTRYPVSLATMLISLYIVFFIIFFGTKALAYGNPDVNNTLNAVIVSFALWTFSILAYSGLSQVFLQEAYQGTLEQLYMSPCGFGWVNVCTIISSFVFSSVITGLILIVMMVTTGKYLTLPPGLLIIFLLTILPIYGLGFILGGLALIFKQIEPLTQLFQYAFIGLIVLPVDRFPALKILPLALGNSIIKKMVSGGYPFSRIPAVDWVVLVATCIFYLAVGWFVFRLCEKAAKIRGLLAHY